MATSETAPPMVSRSSPPILDRSPSNASSPLSDVEDKDADADEMDFDLTSPRATSLARQRQLEGLEVASPSLSTGTDGDESMLSDADVNDSEAETERLYDTPPKNTAGRETVYKASESGVQLFLERRSRAFEHSPSKLQRQIKAHADEADDGSDNDSLSDADDDDDGASAASNGPEQGAKPDESRSPSPARKTSQPTTQDSVPTADAVKDEAIDTKKRKRSSAAEQLEEEQPLRKRTGSVVAPERDFSADNTAIIDDDVPTPTVLTREPSPEDEGAGEGDTSESKSKDVPTQSIEDTPQPARSKSAKRGTNKKRKGQADGGAIESPIDSPVDGGTPAADDDGTRNAEDEQPETNADEEAELAHKEEEQRKKAAWEELTAIEKQFSNFRERLYQERLDQLNREEAMLSSPTPTHPEYLAMLACIDARRDERIRLSNVELRMRMDLLKRKAVAERAQIHTQYHQGIRASRERALEDLGREWYEIQHERRRAANNIPDFGIRLPATKKEALRAAVAYNKEVSILSGVAKYQGFPGAPDIRGAREEEIEGDFEAITRTRQSLQQPPPPPAQQFLAETPAPVNVQFGVGRGSTLGPAAEQFLEQTPWANPNHPSHAAQRPRDPVGMAPVLYAGPAGMGRRHSSQQFGSAGGFTNGEAAAAAMHKSNSGNGHERVKKMGGVEGVKREAISHAA